MKAGNLRELIMQMEAKTNGAYNKSATIGEVLELAEMIMTEIELIKNSKSDKIII